MIRLLVDVLFPPSCLICGSGRDSMCETCLRAIRLSHSSPHPFIIPIFDYADPSIRTAIRFLKYYGRKNIAEPLSRQLAGKIRELPEHASYLLVPVPMPRLRKLMRGYNQSELLAVQTGSKLGLSVSLNLLTRRANPKRQVRSAKRSERANNQKGTFACGDASGKRIILIDDVTTTGSTLLEARKTLLCAHANEVIAFVIAH